MQISLASHRQANTNQSPTRPTTHYSPSSIPHTSLPHLNIHITRVPNSLVMSCRPFSMSKDLTIASYFAFATRLTRRPRLALPSASGWILPPHPIAHEALLTNRRGERAGGPVNKLCDQAKTWLARSGHVFRATLRVDPNLAVWGLSVMSDGPQFLQHRLQEA